MGPERERAKDGSWKEPNKLEMTAKLTKSSKNDKITLTQFKYSHSLSFPRSICDSENFPN